MSKPNIFSETKHLKKWAINLANACGGQEVTQTSIKLNRQQANEERIKEDAKAEEQ